MPVTGPSAVNNPDAFVGRVTLNAYEPYPVLTGTQYSSVVTNNAPVIHWVQPQPIWVKNVIVQNSLAASVPAATSAASAGSEALSYALSAFLFTRQDYTSNSSNLSFVGSGSFGLTATLSYTSTAQTFGMSWATNTTGGTSALTTTSSDGNWSNYINGARVFGIPLVTTMTAGEYWMAFQHGSSSATSNSNVTLLSMSQLQLIGQQASVSAGYLGQSATAASVYGANQNVGVIGAAPTITDTMPVSTISAIGRPIWFCLSNA